MLFKKPKPKQRPMAMPSIDDTYVPDRVVEYEDHIRIDDLYCRLMVVDAMPEMIHFGWFNRITVIPGVTLSVTGTPYKYKDASDRVAERLSDLDTELIVESRKGEKKRLLTLQEKSLFYEEFLKDINMHRNNLMAVTVIILVSGDTYKEMLDKCQIVKNELASTRAITLYNRQLDGLKNLLPLAQNDLPEFHDVTVGNFACLSPLISTDFSHPSGIYYGFNETGSPALLNLFIGAPRLNGPHFFITGMTRSGKSATVKGVISRNIIQLDTDNVILDPEGEYELMCEALGGLHIKIHPSMEVMFNPFDIEAEWDKELGLFVNIPAKQDDIVQMVATMIETQGDRITVEERGLASQAVALEYQGRGITHDPESLFKPGGIKTEEGYKAGKSYKDMPTMSSYAQRLHSLGARRLGNILIPFCKGGPQGFFDGQTKVDIRDYNLVCFDLSRLTNEFTRTYGMYVMLSWVWEKFMKRNRQKKKVVTVDEAWLFMKYPDTSAFMSQMARRGAKHNVSLIVASQSFQEFTSKEGQVLLGQCDTKLFLKLKSTEAKALGAIFDLPAEVVDRITNFAQGQGLLSAGNESAIVRFHPFEFEKPFLYSDPESVRVAG